MRWECCEMQLSCRPHKGIVRKTNQDSLVTGESYIGVADGMGGYQGGEVASGLVVEVIAKALDGKTASQSLLHTAVIAANRRVYEEAKQNPSYQNMGTTLSMLWLGEKGKVIVAHVGDSRVYHLRKDAFVAITEDHSVVGELLRNRVITPEMAKTHRYRNMITRAVGINPHVEVDFITVESQVGDIWLVCSAFTTR